MLQRAPTLYYRPIAFPGGGRRPTPVPSMRAIGRRGLGDVSTVQQQIVSQATTQGVDPSLALAVAQNESSFNQSAVSPAGAIGVMQLMPATAAGLGVDPNDVSQNIAGGVAYLKQLLTQFGGNVSAALAAYNWGPGNVASGAMPPASTQSYVSKVLTAQNNYSDVAGTPAGSAASPDLSIADLGDGDLPSVDLSSAGITGDMTPVYIGLGILGGLVAWKLFG